MKRVSVILLVLLLLFVSGCAEKQTEKPQEAQIAPEPVGEQSVEEQPPEERPFRFLTDGGWFTRGSGSKTPYTAPMWYRDGVYDSLLWSPTGEAEDIQGCLAESWKADDGGLTWIFTIRSGVCFSDGSLCTAADIAWAWEETAKAGYDITRIYPMTWEAPVENLFVIHMEEAVEDLPRFLASYGGALPVFNSLGLGTGPYCVDSILPGKGIKLSANRYYDFEPKMPREQHIEVVFFSESDPARAFELLESNAADAALLDRTLWDNVGLTAQFHDDLALLTEDGKYHVLPQSKKLGICVLTDDVLVSLSPDNMGPFGDVCLYSAEFN